MVRDLTEAAEAAASSPEHERLLTSVARPIVLSPARIELAGVARTRYPWA